MTASVEGRIFLSKTWFWSKIVCLELLINFPDYIIKGTEWIQEHFVLKHSRPNIEHKTLKMDRSSNPEVFCKKGVLRNFAKFTGKHLCQRTWPATLLTKNTFLTEHLRWLLLNGLQTGGLKNDDIFLKITSLQYLWVKRLLKQYSEWFYGWKIIPLYVKEHVFGKSIMNKLKANFC